jgi:hypothetical protein
MQLFGNKILAHWHFLTAVVLPSIRVTLATLTAMNVTEWQSK